MKTYRYVITDVTDEQNVREIGSGMCSEKALAVVLRQIADEVCPDPEAAKKAATKALIDREGDRIAKDLLAGKLTPNQAFQEILRTAMVAEQAENLGNNAFGKQDS